MASTKYTYSISNDFPNNIVNLIRLTSEITGSDITIALDYMNTDDDDCDIWFKADLTSPDETTLSGIVAVHTGAEPDVIEPPVMADGRPLVRADTRPLDTQTYFTMAGDTASGIGKGTILKWDFSNDDHETGCDYFITPDGYKTKHIELTFLDPIYLKDGTLYFFDAPWGSYCDMHVVAPSGSYYPNDDGAIPASALSLPGTQMYSYAAADIEFLTYVNRHHMYGDCPMGDELNAEGAAVDPVPVGWKVVGHITTVSGDNTSKGFASFECYRARTVLLEGDTP
jgi:hypothetical protein